MYVYTSGVPAAVLTFNVAGTNRKYAISGGPLYRCHVWGYTAGGAAVQKALGRTESMMVEMGCVVAVSESCKIVAQERTGFIREPPYPQGFVVKITGELQT